MAGTHVEDDRSWEGVAGDSTVMTHLAAHDCRGHDNAAQIPSVATSFYRSARRSTTTLLPKRESMTNANDDNTHDGKIWSGKANKHGPEISAVRKRGLAQQQWELLKPYLLALGYTLPIGGAALNPDGTVCTMQDLQAGMDAATDLWNRAMSTPTGEDRTEIIDLLTELAAVTVAAGIDEALSSTGLIAYVDTPPSSDLSEPTRVGLVGGFSRATVDHWLRRHGSAPRACTSTPWVKSSTTLTANQIAAARDLVPLARRGRAASDQSDRWFFGRFGSRDTAIGAAVCVAAIASDWSTRTGLPVAEIMRDNLG